MTVVDAAHVARLAAISSEFFERVPHNEALGIELIRLGHATSVLRLPYNKALVGHPESGVLHGGVISALLDACSGAAVFMALPELCPIATLDLRIDYLKPATPQQAVLAEAHCYRLTRSVGFTRCVAYHNDIESPIASAAGTFMLSAKNATRRKPEPT